MSSVLARDAEVSITEQTLKELMNAVTEAKNLGGFTKEPMPDGDMSQKDYIDEQRKRGIIRVKSEFSKINFKIALDGGKNENQESLGYRLIK